MDFFRFSPRRPESELLAPPPPRRMSTPAGDRLATILENHSDGGEDRRDNAQSRASHLSGLSWSTKSRTGTLPRASSEPMPPPYASREWHPEDVRYFDKEEGATAHLKKRRGGWGRFLIIAAVVLLILAIGLGVGLGVGLGRRKGSDEDGAASSSAPSEAGPAQSFPLGQYTFTTALRQVQTDCTSNAATWRCYPYSTYQSDDSATGLALFNWVMTNTGPVYATNSSPPQTDSRGIPANISVSSSRDPFSIPLRDQALTFVNDNNNPRLVFTFTYAKNVVPSAAVGGNNAASTCYFNQTSFDAAIYLSDSRPETFPGSGLASSSQVQGGYQSWPYAVEIRETAGGGQDVPNCYESVNGGLGPRIGDFTSQSADRQCSCDYRNFT